MQAVVETGGDVRSLKGPHALRRRQRHRRAAGALRHQGGPGSQRVPGRGAGRRAGGTRVARRRARAAAARRHRPRGRGRQPARRRRAGHRGRRLSQRARRLAADGGPDIYRMLLDGELQVVTFTSASAVRNFAKIYGAEQAADLLSRTVVAAIGPVTAEAAARLGIQVTCSPPPTPCRRWWTPSSVHVTGREGRHRAGSRGMTRTVAAARRDTPGAVADGRGGCAQPKPSGRWCARRG